MPEYAARWPLSRYYRFEVYLSGSGWERRFARPMAFQSWDNKFLPDELKDENPLHIWRTVKDELTKDALH